jgi:chorismate dehydratase
MIFAKIDFINLLPFHIYLKKNVKSSQLKQIIEHNKSYPSLINKRFKKRKVHSAFISSIKSKNEKALDLGIVAKNEVLSVLAIPGEYKKDYQSDTSNALASVLNIKGQVLIGDKALKYYHSAQKNNEIIDLALKWKEKYNLPFVFARLCVNKNEKQLRALVKNFDKKKIKIPQYILEIYTKRSGLTKDQIKDYLKKIDYDIKTKEKKSLKLFFKLTQQKGI